MHADELVPAVFAAVAVVCLLAAGRVDGLDDYVPAAAASQEVEPQATTQNPGHYFPRPGLLPLPHHLSPRPFAAGGGGGGYVPQAEVAPEVTTHAGASFSGSGSFGGGGGGYFPQQPTTEPEPEQTTEPAPEEPHPQQTATTEPEAATADQGDFYRTGETPTTPEPPATPTTPRPETLPTPEPEETPETPETPATPSAPEQQSAGGGYAAGGGANKQVDDDGEPVDGLSPKAIANILKEHNAFRAKEHVPPLTWNATVAQYAQHYAQQRKGDCALKHSTGPYGENLMYGEGKAWTWRHTVDEWSDEKKNYHYGSNSCDAGKQCGHYTAVVWKGTTSVGCGRVTCTTGDTLMVCSYYPPGNYDGEKPY